jgi:hypothetical protein
MSKNIKSSNTSLNRKFADVQFVNKNKKLKDVVFKLIVYVLLFSCSKYQNDTISIGNLLNTLFL